MDESSQDPNAIPTGRPRLRPFSGQRNAESGPLKLGGRRLARSPHLAPVVRPATDPPPIVPVAHHGAPVELQPSHALGSAATATRDDSISSTAPEPGAANRIAVETNTPFPDVGSIASSDAQVAESEAESSDFMEREREAPGAARVDARATIDIEVENEGPALHAFDSDDVESGAATSLEAREVDSPAAPETEGASRESSEHRVADVFGRSAASALDLSTLANGDERVASRRDDTQAADNITFGSRRATEDIDATADLTIVDLAINDDVTADDVTADDVTDDDVTDDDVTDDDEANVVATYEESLDDVCRAGTRDEQEVELATDAYAAQAQQGSDGADQERQREEGDRADVSLEEVTPEWRVAAPESVVGAGQMDAHQEDVALDDARDPSSSAGAFAADASVADAFVTGAFAADAFVADAFVADAFVTDAFVADAFVTDAFVIDDAAYAVDDAADDHDAHAREVAARRSSVTASVAPLAVDAVDAEDHADHVGESLEASELTVSLDVACAGEVVANAAASDLLDAELAGFALRPEESLEAPEPIPGIDGMLAIGGVDDERFGAEPLRLVGEATAFEETGATGEAHEAVEADHAGEAYMVAPVSADAPPTIDAEPTHSEPGREPADVASEHGVRFDPRGATPLLTLLAPGEQELRHFVQRSERQAHVLSTLEMVARRVRGGEIVPSVDAGASPEAVLASLLASILSSRT